MKKFRSLLMIFNIMLLFVVQGVHSRSCCGQITQGDIDTVGGVFTISTSGSYQLAESVTGKIVIHADDVVLDLCGKKITNTDDEGVEVHADYKNAIIKNGTIESTNNRGILVNSNSDCFGPTLEKLRVQNCGFEAVLFDNVLNGRIKGCEFISSSTGLVLNQSAQVIVEDTIASCNDLAGFALQASSYNCFGKCKAIANGGSGTDNVDRFGFVSTNGCGNLFQECCAEANTIPFFDTIGFCRSVAGFAFVGTETCSKIIDCKSENNWAPFEIFDKTETQGPTLVKSATPYGILLKQQLYLVGENNDELELVTAVDPGDEADGGNVNDTVYSVDWSPDGKYLAVGGLIKGTDSKDLRVYAFDLSASPTLTLLASVDPGDEPGGQGDDDIVYSVDWSPDGKYLAVGGQISGADKKDLRIYVFDPAASMPLALLTAVNPGDEQSGQGGDDSVTVLSVDWSPDGKYLAVGGFISGAGADNKNLRVYVFDPAASTPLALLTAVNPGDEAGGQGGVFESVYSVDWSPDGKYLAVGGFISGTDSKDLRVYVFDLSASPTLSLVTAVDPGDEPGGQGGNDFVYSVDWSPDGCFLAVGGFILGTDSKDLRVYAFDLSASPTLSLVTAVDPGQGETVSIRSVDWSPDGKYLAVGGVIGETDGKDLRVYAFDLSASLTLTLLAAVDPGDEPGGQGGGDSVRSARWSPDGKYLAVGGQIYGTDNKDLRVYKALDFPTKNVIKRNIVACNCIRHHEHADACGCNDNICPKGVGISGTSICNMIMENEAYNNPFNYQFVTNVFDQRFGNMPSLLQNIALKSCEPVCIPDDCARISKETRAEVKRIESKLDTLLNSSGIQCQPCDLSGVENQLSIIEQQILYNSCLLRHIYTFLVDPGNSLPAGPLQSLPPSPISEPCNATSSQL